MAISTGLEPVTFSLEGCCSFVCHTGGESQCRGNGVRSVPFACFGNRAAESSVSPNSCVVACTHVSGMWIAAQRDLAHISAVRSARSAGYTGDARKQEFQCLCRDLLSFLLVRGRAA